MDIDNFSKSVAALAAVIGIPLGIYNLWVAISSRKLKLKIIPQSITLQYDDNQIGGSIVVNSIDEFNEATGEFLIEVINMSSFPVIVNQVGFKLNIRPDSFIIDKPIIKDNGPWPRKLEHRDSVSLYCSLSDLINSPRSISIKNAFAETACGTTCTGTSVALKKLVEFIKDERRTISQHQ
jgi:hypothetical protein